MLWRNSGDKLDFLYLIFGTSLLTRWSSSLTKNYGENVHDIPTFEFWSFATAVGIHFILVIGLVIYNSIDVVLMFMGK